MPLRHEYGSGLLPREPTQIEEGRSQNGGR